MVEEEVTPKPGRAGGLALDRRPVDPDARGREGEAAGMEQEARQARDGKVEAVKRVDRGCACPRGLQDPPRPIGSFMFLGPTGVGKTELTRRSR